MSTPHHQQSLQRKFLYIGLILALFFVMVFYRPYVVDAAATRLSLREEDRGDEQLADKAILLSLTGLRGVVVTGLWYGYNEAKKKNEWNEMELMIRQVAKLQPHFVQPWIFMSWDVAYNVAVQCDRESDQYFYITRGIELLAEGERKNRNNPEMRYAIGNYNQQKIMLADRTSMLKALFQMSSIDPVQRHPGRFKKPNAEGRMALDVVEFEKFCQEHPHLVRGLREKVRCETPEHVVQFLEENYRIPSLYVDDPGWKNRPWSRDEATRLRPFTDRFPALPPPGPRPDQDTGALTYDSQIEDHVDGYLVARAWYSYAVEPLPKPSWIPGRYKAPEPGQKAPRFTTQLFRNYPAIAQSFAAKRLEDDGWFDDEGWLITDWFKLDQFSDGKSARVGGGSRSWAKDAWLEAWGLWRDIGAKHGLYLEPEDERTLKVKAEAWAQEHHPPEGQPPPDIPEEELHDDGLRAFIYLWNYEFYRRLSNFPHFLAQARVFADPATVDARKHLYLADRARATANRREAIDEYEKALRDYAAVLKKNEEFRMDTEIAEEALDHELKYLRLCRELHGQRWKQALAAQAFLGLAASGPSPIPESVTLAQLGRPHLLPEMDINGPLDDAFGLDFMEEFKRIKNPARMPPGFDMRKLMTELGLDPARLPAGADLKKIMAERGIDPRRMQAGMMQPPRMPRQIQQPPKGIQPPRQGPKP